MVLNCADVLTLLTGTLFVPVDRIYTLYNTLTGDNLYTLQLPSAFDACLPFVRSRWPEIETALDQLEIDPNTYKTVLEQARGKWGDRFEMPPIPLWEHRNPLEELAKMVTSTD